MTGVPRTNPGWPHFLEQTMDTARRFVQSLWVRILYLSGALWWAKRQLNQHGAVIVLTFHRVLEDKHFSHTDSLPNIVVRKSTFNRLARYVARGFNIVDVRETQPGDPSSRLRIAFTFDDGWQDNFENALPVLSTYQIPATIFLCTGLMGQKTPFWPEQVHGTLYESLRKSYGRRADRLIEALVESLKYCSAEARKTHLNLLLQQTESAPASFYDRDATLNWEQILVMRRQGIAFGSHSHTHQILTSVSLERAKIEACQSKLAFEEALHEACDTFAYPNGDWSPDLRDLVAASGYRLAFTTDRDAWLPGTDRLAIPRSNVQEEDLIGFTGRFSAAMFDYATFWKVWQTVRRAQAREAKVMPARAAQEAQ